ncbi:MFS transporter [Streptacidiphilus albus]|uniref:MFS transporter n=1 Tax=Streptacidiphilus albus TaxID=105425 RepID=UPI00054B177A|nr:MFS transporter [Streptacidiphilus albus]
MYLADRAAPAEGAAPSGGPRQLARAVSSTVLALGAVSLITDVSSEMVTAVLPLYLVTGLGLSPLGFGVLDGLYNGVAGLVQLVGGHLADRGRNHKLVAGLGYGFSALCRPLLLIAHTLTPLGAILALDRTGKGLRTSPRDALISLSSAPEHRGRAFGVHRAMDTAGAALGPITAFLILRQAANGYDAIFGVSGCIAALGVLVLILFVPGRPRAAAGAPAEAAPARKRVDLREAATLLKLPRLRALAGCSMLLGLTTISDAFVYLLLQHRTGISDEWFPLLPLGTATGFLLLAVPLGALADRIGRRTVFLAGHGALLLGYGLLLWAPAGPALPFLVLALHGTFYAATDGVLPAAVADVVPEALRGTGLALVGTGQALARFLCSLAFGAAWTAWGDGPALTASAVGLLCCAVTAGVVLRPTRTPQGDQ